MSALPLHAGWFAPERPLGRPRPGAARLNVILPANGLTLRRAIAPAKIGLGSRIGQLAIEVIVGNTEIGARRCVITCNAQGIRRRQLDIRDEIAAVGLVYQRTLGGEQLRRIGNGEARHAETPSKALSRQMRTGRRLVLAEWLRICAASVLPSNSTIGAPAAASSTRMRSTPKASNYQQTKHAVCRVNRTEYTLQILVRDTQSGAAISNDFTGLRMGANYAWPRGVKWLMEHKLLPPRRRE